MQTEEVVTCPKCAAPTGVACTVRRDGSKRATHMSRRKAFRKLLEGVKKLRERFGCSVKVTALELSKENK